MAKNGELKRFLIELHSPYYLIHPLDGLAALITIEIFDGENYDLWEKMVRTALKSKHKLRFIYETKGGGNMVSIPQLTSLPKKEEKLACGKKNQSSIHAISYKEMHVDFASQWLECKHCWLLSQMSRVREVRLSQVLFF